MSDETDTTLFGQDAAESLKDAAKARLHEACAYIDNDNGAVAVTCIEQAKQIMAVWEAQD